MAGNRNKTHPANNERKIEDRNNAQLLGASMQPTSKHEIQRL
jgi:hypothetical protein